jgi:hypothetical protein
MTTYIDTPSREPPNAKLVDYEGDTLLDTLKAREQEKYLAERRAKNNGVPTMNAYELKQIAEKNDGYQYPELNNKLYCHFKGFRKIEGLEDYIGLTSLFLESNAIQKIEGLDNQTKLRSLFLHQNMILKIENLGHLDQLVTLNLSSNEIKCVEGLSNLLSLKTLNISKNRLTDKASIEHLEGCEALTNLDISANQLNSEEVLESFKKVPKLVYLKLEGNPFVSDVKHYRKTMLNLMPKLVYMDRPVFDVDRIAAEAWAKGGSEAEIAAKQAYARGEREKEQESMAKYRKWKHEVREKKLKELEEKGIKPYFELEKERSEQEKKAKQDRIDTLMGKNEDDSAVRANEKAKGKGLKKNNTDEGSDDDVPQVEDVTELELGSSKQQEDRGEGSSLLRNGEEPPPLSQFGYNKANEAPQFTPKGGIGWSEAPKKKHVPKSGLMQKRQEMLEKREAQDKHLIQIMDDREAQDPLNLGTKPMPHISDEEMTKLVLEPGGIEKLGRQYWAEEGVQFDEKTGGVIADETLKPKKDAPGAAEAEEKARLKAWEEKEAAKKEAKEAKKAEEKAKQDADEKAKCEAEERERKKVERQAKREADEKARQEEEERQAREGFGEERYAGMDEEDARYMRVEDSLKMYHARRKDNKSEEALAKAAEAVAAAGSTKPNKPERELTREERQQREQQEEGRAIMHRLLGKRGDAEQPKAKQIDEKIQERIEKQARDEAATLSQQGTQMAEDSDDGDEWVHEAEEEEEDWAMQRQRAKQGVGSPKASGLAKTRAAAAQGKGKGGYGGKGFARKGGKGKGKGKGKGYGGKGQCSDSSGKDGKRNSSASEPVQQPQSRQSPPPTSAAAASRCDFAWDAASDKELDVQVRRCVFDFDIIAKILSRKTGAKLTNAACRERFAAMTAEKKAKKLEPTKEDAAKEKAKADAWEQKVKIAREQRLQTEESAINRKKAEILKSKPLPVAGPAPSSQPQQAQSPPEVPKQQKAKKKQPKKSKPKSTPCFPSAASLNHQEAPVAAEPYVAASASTDMDELD